MGPPLGRNFRGSGPHARTGRRVGFGRGRQGGQFRDCGEQLASIADGRDADLPEVFRRYMTENLVVDPVLAKGRMYLSRPRLRSHPPTSMAAPHMAQHDDPSVAPNCPAARPT
jgi:hypothetical protein